MTTRFYYWIYGRDTSNMGDGKPFLLYGGENETECRQKGMEMLSGLDFQIKKLATRDISTASRMLKYGKLEKSHSLREAKQRLGHDRSVRRANRRRQSSGQPNWGM